jgi:PilZ domain
MDQHMDERRHYPRLAIDLPVILRHGGRIIPATALNMSCGGMYLHVEPSEIATKAPIEVIFDLSMDERDVAMCGKVTRVDADPSGVGFGVQFTNLFSVSHKALQRYLQKNLN